MTPQPNLPDSLPPSFARTLLDLAAEAEGAERRLKEAVLAAAKAGDSARVAHIMESWLSRPAVDILAEIDLNHDAVLR